MRKNVFPLLIILLSLTLSASVVFAKDNSFEINLFYSATCPHCKKERVFLDTLKEKYPEIKINEYEIIYNKENQKLLSEFYKRYQVPEREWGLVPVTFTPDKYFVGFNEQIGRNIEMCLEECINSNGKSLDSYKIKIPVIGELDLSKMSLLAMTATLGALDGFNPCAMWVLLFLLTLLINVRSRKRMYLIAGTFILASGIVYYLILNAWLKLFLAVSYVNITRMLIGIFAIGLGIWQIKNFFNFKPGVCSVTDGNTGFQRKLKNGLKNRAEKLVLSPLNIGIIGGVIMLALGVNLVEFFCSAGLPAIFTRVLALNNVSAFNYHLYLVLYTFIFMLDDLIIFSIAVFTLSKIGFTEKYNYWATLVGGVLIFLLGVLLIFKPEALMFV